MKSKLIALALLCLPAAQAQAAPAQITARPYNIGGQPVDPQFAVAVNPDGSLGDPISARFQTIAPTYTDGQYGVISMSNKGGAATAVFDGVNTWANTLSAVPYVAGTSNAQGLAASANVALYKATLPGYTDGQFGMVIMDPTGNLRTLAVGPSTSALTGLTNSTALFTAASSYTGVPLATRSVLSNGVNSDAAISIGGNIFTGSATGVPAVENAGQANSQITTATTTNVKASGGILHTVAVNTCVASATIKIYNALTATGTPITITCPSTVGNPFVMTYDIFYGTGITVVTSGATDVTIAYR